MAEKPEDFNLPNAVVTKIIKDALPDGINVSKEARAALSKAASIFVLYTTSCANNFALKAKRKTLLGSDVLAAIKDMEFEKFLEPLKESLELYRQDKAKKEKGSADGKRGRSKTKKGEKTDEGREKEDSEVEDESDDEDMNENGENNMEDSPD